MNPRVALYARVSTADQTCENQLLELRRYCEARDWTAVEYVDQAQSGAKDRRPALDQLLVDARRRRVDALVVWKLDRLGRNLRHLVLTIDELTAMGVTFTSLGEGIDTTTAAGKLQLHLLAAISEFERARIIERVHAGLARARRQGVRLGRPRQIITLRDLERVADLPLRAAAAVLGVPATRVYRERKRRTFHNPCPSSAAIDHTSVSISAA